MRLADLLPREHILAPLQERTLRGALDALLRRLAEAGALEDADTLAAVMLGVRARDIVCIGPRVALPHCRSDAVDRVTLALGVSPAPLQADRLAPDAHPQIVVLILAPPDATAQYLQIVASLASHFRDEEAIDRLAAAQSPEEVLEITRQAELRMQPRLTVRDIMSQAVDFVTPGDPLRQAVDLMIRKRLRAVPVVGEKHEVLGIVSERDIMRGLLPRIPRAGDSPPETTAGHAETEALRVRDVMSRSVLCVSEELGLEEAANMMINKDVEQLPVTGEGKLVGFLSRGDLIRKLFGQ
ncbi:MAG TPA: CBS domain-containing protein [Longimicrobiales bacterium]|nr:CBS domain-containing protein [Longimicrobiales bacterium]